MRKKDNQLKDSGDVLDVVAIRVPDEPPEIPLVLVRGMDATELGWPWRYIASDNHLVRDMVRASGLNGGQLFDSLCVDDGLGVTPGSWRAISRTLWQRCQGRGSFAPVAGSESVPKRIRMAHAHLAEHVYRLPVHALDRLAFGKRSSEATPSLPPSEDGAQDPTKHPFGSDGTGLYRSAIRLLSFLMKNQALLLRSGTKVNALPMGWVLAGCDKRMDLIIPHPKTSDLRAHLPSLSFPKGTFVFAIASAEDDLDTCASVSRVQRVLGTLQFWHSAILSHTGEDSGIQKDNPLSNFLRQPLQYSILDALEWASLELKQVLQGVVVEACPTIYYRYDQKFGFLSMPSAAGNPAVEIRVQRSQLEMLQAFFDASGLPRYPQPSALEVCQSAHIPFRTKRGVSGRLPAEVVRVALGKLRGRIKTIGLQATHPTEARALLCLGKSVGGGGGVRRFPFRLLPWRGGR